MVSHMQMLWAPEYFLILEDSDMYTLYSLTSTFLAERIHSLFSGCLIYQEK